MMKTWLIVLMIVNLCYGMAIMIVIGLEEFHLLEVDYEGYSRLMAVQIGYAVVMLAVGIAFVIHNGIKRIIS